MKGFGFVEHALPLLESIVAEPDADNARDHADLFPLRVDSTLPDHAAARTRLLELTGADDAVHRQTAARILGALAYQASVYSAMFNALPEPDLLRRLEQMAVDDPADAVAREAGAALGLVGDPTATARCCARSTASGTRTSRRLSRRWPVISAAAEAPPRYQFLSLKLTAGRGAGARARRGGGRPGWPSARRRSLPSGPSRAAGRADGGRGGRGCSRRRATGGVASPSGRQAIEDMLSRLLAEKAYEPVIRLAAAVSGLAPDFLTVPVLHGQALEAIGRQEEAIACLGEAIPHTPTPLPLRYERGGSTGLR